jgi:chemotaxis protein methyltransferase CheR
VERFLTDEEFRLFSRVIYDQSGIHFSAANRSILESRLKERLRIAKLEKLRQYYDLINRDEGELRVLLDSVTTNLTRFFRNTAHFQAFENHVLVDILRHKGLSGQRTLRVWSAGCSTGEEPYSIAMVMHDKMPAGFVSEIIASDLSLKSLLVAQEGFYPESRLAGVPENYLDRYFERKTDGFVVSPQIRKMIKFDYHNLKHESGLRGLDIVFCRNVLIYFDAEAQKAVVRRFFQSMNSYSYLFIGHSESLFGMDTGFEFVRTEWSTLYRKNTKAV